MFAASVSSRMDDADRVAATVRRVLESRPVVLGVLFGSYARGTAGSHSDVDVAVVFEPSVDDRLGARLDLGVELSLAFGTDDIDVVDLADVRPAVGYSALEQGRLLVGDPGRAEKLTAEFDSERERTTDQDRRERFDAALERLEELV